MPIPRATYRFQLHAGQDFDAVSRNAAYLRRLGISHVYASPYLKARPGSLHGYDIVAHDELNPELGGEAGFERMVAVLNQHDLRHIADFVPNHMGVGGADNPLWLDVLEWGRDSRYAGWFDIAWESEQRYLQGKVLVPMLADQYGVALEAGRLQLRFDAERGEFAVWAYDTHKLPICPLHYAQILSADTPTLEYLSDDFAALNEWWPQTAHRAGELKQQLAQRVRDDAQTGATIDSVLRRINGEDPAVTSRPELAALIRQQHWRATHFRVAGDDINYRRFFNINELAGLRVELPEVFEHQHRLMLSLIRAGKVDGLRIDHIDGLLDPAGYLAHLCSEQGAHLPADNTVDRPYLVVEKILSRGEKLPIDWPVDGTTGYEFCNQALGVLIDPAGEEVLRRVYAEFTGERSDFAEVVRNAKLHIMNNEMASELNVLASEAARVARQTPHTADFTRNLLLRALRQVIACLSVYRTYLNSRGTLLLPELAYIQQAFRQAQLYENNLDPSVFDFLLRLLSGDLVRERQGFVRHAVLRCAMKWQQYSGPVMAKGQEDTAFYRYAAFLALNEVGGDPDRFGFSVTEFHEQNAERAAHWPHTLLATSTHDTKWGEDARARLAVLSELPQEWAVHVQEWNRMLGLHEDGRLRPHLNAIYFFYQLLIATWPAELTAPMGLDSEILERYVERVQATMRKAMREARLGTRWSHPDEEYEDTLLNWLRGVLDPRRSSNFFASFLELQKRVADLGVRNSVAQTTLKLTAPGVPDIYQGSERWNFSMVDPDNRRAVDFEHSAWLLEEVLKTRATDPTQGWSRWLRDWHDGRIKLALVHALLQFRAQHGALFGTSIYEPCTVRGRRDDEVLAFTRRADEAVLLVVVRRFTARDPFEETSAQVQLPAVLATRRWHDVLTAAVYAPSEILSAAAVCTVLPVAVLYSASE